MTLLDVDENMFEDSVSYVETPRFDTNFKSFTAVKTELLSFFDSRNTLSMNLKRPNKQQDVFIDELFSVKSLTHNNFNPIVETISTKIPYKKNCIIEPISLRIQSEGEVNINSSIKVSKFQKFWDKINKRQFSLFKRNRATTATNTTTTTATTFSNMNHRFSFSLRRNQTWQNIKSNFYKTSTPENISTSTSVQQEQSLQITPKYSLFNPPSKIESLVEGQLLLASAQLTTSGVSRFNFDLSSFFNDARPTIYYSDSQITKNETNSSSLGATN